MAIQRDNKLSTLIFVYTYYCLNWRFTFLLITNYLSCTACTQCSKRNYFVLVRIRQRMDVSITKIVNACLQMFASYNIMYKSPSRDGYHYYNEIKHTIHQFHNNISGPRSSWSKIRWLLPPAPVLGIGIPEVKWSLHMNRTVREIED